MHLHTFSSSRLLFAGLLCSLVAVMSTGCDKNDKQAPPPTAPIVTTAALTNISFNAATGGGSIVSDGGATVTASGIVWSKTNATPTLADSVVAGTTATGTFTSDITGLEENSSYYIRAFATNSVGTGYGNVVTLNTTNDTNKVHFTYNGEEVVYGIIVSPTTGRKWLDRNLGAQQVATSYDDYKAYGDLFQWGRPDDGHQLMNWTSSTEGIPVNGVTTTLATSDEPGHNNFIDGTAQTTANDWRSDNNSNRWATVPQGPCPAGWHVPTKTEWTAECERINDNTGEILSGYTTGGITNRIEAYNKLKLVVPGLRNGAGNGAGQLSIANSGSPVTGGIGYYWASSLDSFNQGLGLYTAENLEIDADGIQFGFNVNSTGYSIRCIKD
jgi:uncharacterized protein (TIGR02145 family)